MIIYVIIAFVAILIGMAISVSAFGTGGKRKKIFQDIYFSVEDVDGIGRALYQDWRILSHLEDGEPGAEVFCKHRQLL